MRKQVKPIESERITWNGARAHAHMEERIHSHQFKHKNTINNSQRIRAHGKRNNETFNKIRLIICSSHFYHFSFHCISPGKYRIYHTYLLFHLSVSFVALLRKTILRAERKCSNFLALCVIWIDQCNERATYHNAVYKRNGHGHGHREKMKGKNEENYCEEAAKL